MTVTSPQSIKGYQLLDLIGEGAYGVVFRAHQQHVDRHVAIKIILPQYANQPDFIRRFESEAQLVAQLEHLHIVPLYDYWRDPEGAYLVMRLMKGGSLAEALHGRQPWQPDAAAGLIDQVASALDAAHQKGIVHRDLKPANILLDEDGNAYLSDFGIAKQLDMDADTTQAEIILGTPAYITPEQVQSLPVTPQTDIYALGILLYQLLVGEHPFPGSSNAELVVKHLQEPLPYVRDTHPDLPAALDGVIQRATAKDPADRYPDAASLALDFRRALQLEVDLPEVPEEDIYNPYKGLRAFQVADAADFFGREALTGQLLAHLASPTQAGRFLAVVGPSGSGKSSVVKAGLLPALQKGALPGSDQWFITEMQPGSQPLNELALALLGISADPQLDLVEQLGAGKHGLVQAARSVLPDDQSQLLLVIDQFEELFSLVDDEGQRSRFLDLLHTAVTDPNSQLRVALTLRADFYDRPLLHPHFGKLVEGHTVVVLPLTPEELELAIQKPAERAGAVLEKDLAAAISADVIDQPGALPLLQYALTELFERREGRMLTHQVYQHIGGVLGALGRRAEQVYADLDPAGKAVSRQVFLRLVTLGEGAEDTRRRVLRQQIESLFKDQPSNVIELFGKARLLSFDHDPATRGPTVEVAHEALLREWHRLRGWLDESRADIRMQVVLSNATADWLEGNEESSYLLRGSRLAQFEVWSEETSLALTPDERRFLEASLEFEAQRKAQQAALERRSRNFLRALVAVFAVAAIIAVGLTIFAFNQQGIAQDNAATAVAEADARATQQAIAENEAEARTVAEEQALEERDRAVEAEQDALEQREEALRQASIGLASQAELQSEGRSPETAVLLALEALENYPYTWQAEKALGNSILQSRLRAVIPYDDYFQTVEWSSDGDKILISGMEMISFDPFVWEIANTRILDASTGEELLRITEGDPNISRWSPDESLMLGLNEKDGHATVWDMESGDVHLTLGTEDIEGDLNTNYVDWQPWSPAGDRFLIYNTNGLVKIFDSRTGEILQVLSGHAGEYSEDQFPRVNQAMWSPMGDLVAVSSVIESTVIVYQSDIGRELYTIPGEFEDNRVLFGSWSPNGDRFVTRGLGGAKVYDMTTGQQVLDLSVPQTYVGRALWSPDGSRILTHDGATATVWDAESGQVLSRITDIVYVSGVEWSPSGDLAAIGGADGFIHIWDMATGQEVQKLAGTFGWAWWFRFSPDGKHLLSIGDDNKINIFDLTEASLFIPMQTCNIITNTAWSPDGQQVAFGSGCPPDYPVKIWDASNDELLLELIGNQVVSDWVSWSPSGDRILTTHADGSVNIWDASNGGLLQTFTGHELNIYSAAWSPDESQIATGDIKGNLILWDPSSNGKILTFSGHKQGPTIYSIHYSPDGLRVISTNEEGEALIWDPVTGEVLIDLFPEDYKIGVSSSAWTKDGTRVILFTADGFVRIFDSKTGDELDRFSTRSGSTQTFFSLSPSEEHIIIGGNDNVATVWDLTTGTEILTYEIGGYVIPTYSPDGTQVLIGSTEGDLGKLQIFPVWDSLEELIDYAKECCVVRELTADEREVFGLTPR